MMQINGFLLFIFCCVKVRVKSQILIDSTAIRNSCTNKDGIEVNCVNAKDCPELLESIRRRGRHDFEVCRYEGFDQIVCCPSSNEVLVRQPATNIPVEPATSKAQKACVKYVQERPYSMNLHIIGGDETDITKFPHMASVGHSEHVCGASLISNRYLLTAAHCVVVRDKKPTKIRFNVTSLDDESNAQDYNIDEIIPHPNYVIRTKKDDIALIKVDRDVNFTKFAYPACLETDEFIPTKLPLYITGWGQYDLDKHASSIKLKEARMQEKPISECKDYLWKRKFNYPLSSQMQICGQDKKSNTCRGDSGGPLEYRKPELEGVWTVGGITSFGPGCDKGGHGIYTRVSSYVDWIEQIVWK